MFRLREAHVIWNRHTNQVLGTEHPYSYCLANAIERGKRSNLVGNSLCSTRWLHWQRHWRLLTK